MFRDELFAGDGPVTVWINSPGGDCVAASQIYSMLMDYTGSVTVKIDGVAASAASVIAMAGTTVLMAPTALMMIHNPMTLAFGDHEDMQKAIEMLDEVKESIINAYEIKTGQSRAKINTRKAPRQVPPLDGAEARMNAYKAIELGFADDILKDEKTVEEIPAYAFSGRAAENSLMNKICAKIRPRASQAPPAPAEEPLPAAGNKPDPAEASAVTRGRSVDDLMGRLNLIKP